MGFEIGIGAIFGDLGVEVGLWLNPSREEDKCVIVNHT